MKYSEFEKIMSFSRMNRYEVACGRDSRKAMTLYRMNLRLSQELFTVISCFEVAIRNAIDREYTARLGADWLRDVANAGGIFDKGNCIRTKEIIGRALTKLGRNYTHHKLLTDMDLGFWRFLFAQPQFSAGSHTLLKVFPSKPKSSATMQYNNHFVFNELRNTNDLRNRIAHHEPICFEFSRPVKSTTYARQQYALLRQFFQWMSIDEGILLYGIDHINEICNRIDSL